MYYYFSEYLCICACDKLCVELYVKAVCVCGNW